MDATLLITRKKLEEIMREEAASYAANIGDDDFMTGFVLIMHMANVHFNILDKLFKEGGAGSDADI